MDVGILASWVSLESVLGQPIHHSCMLHVVTLGGDKCCEQRGSPCDHHQQLQPAGQLGSGTNLTKLFQLVKKSKALITGPTFTGPGQHSVADEHGTTETARWARQKGQSDKGRQTEIGIWIHKQMDIDKHIELHDTRTFCQPLVGRAKVYPIQAFFEFIMGVSPEKQSLLRSTRKHTESLSLSK